MYTNEILAYGISVKRTLPDYMKSITFEFTLSPRGHNQFMVFFHYRDTITDKTHSHLFDSEESMADAIARFSDWLRIQPTSTQARTIHARSTLTTAIESCYEAGIDVPFINILKEEAQRLSTNILTFQKNVDLERENIKSRQNEIPF